MLIETEKKWLIGKSAALPLATDTLRKMTNDYLETILLATLETKSHPMLPLIDRTNNRVYDAFEEKGCDATTAWESHDINKMSEDGTRTAVNAFTFTLPITIKSGCVERAIANAGG
ncbi:hypothetical protein F5Y09DRAFT_337042 [Xylaria sp. FL1042]|nr:hypothetical protein F5Y09DRAFT_337042 [Xylaria sp. FL1042]